jgi:predicted ATPase/class 3 adenylate cyclase
VRDNLPSGTVTLLFTDVEGSTKLLHELRAEAYAAALFEHRRLLREAFARHGGVEVDTEGDAFFVAFVSAMDAVAAASEGQQALRDGPIRVRMGLHTGTPHLTEQGYVGEDVHLGARISAVGHGGQVLVSAATRAALDAAVELTDLGEHRLKDFKDPIWIYQLGSERFPPLRSIHNINLPRAASSFVGREREVDDVAALLTGGARLVTLTGPGGTGKTRLALEAAAIAAGSFRNGTFWLDLAAISDPLLVVPSIAATIGARDALAEHIAQREMLLVVDNLEQVIAVAGELARLVEACPNLCLLITSRERLQVRGETEYAVAPLPRDAAVQLFADRSGLEGDAVIAQLAARLDNLPLAIELAAARSRVLSPAQILARVGERLDLLKAGRDAESRQQTLRATIEWSYDLLSSDERELFARLGVFSGGWTIDAAEAVAEADLSVLASLVDKSLVRRSGERLSMLETIRQFAAEKLSAHHRHRDIEGRHAAYYLAVAEQAAPHLRTFSREWVDRLEDDHDNLRHAFDHLLAQHDERRVQRLAATLSDFWLYGGHVAEAARRIDLALALDAGRTPSRAKLLLAGADVAIAVGDVELARERSSAALELSREFEDEWSAAYALHVLAVASVEMKAYGEALHHQKLALDLFTRLGDDASVAAATRTLAWVHHSSGDVDRARRVHEQNLEHVRRHGLREAEVDTLGSLSMIALASGRLTDAASLARENLLAARELGSTIHLAQALARAADVLATTGTRPDVAVRLLGCFAGLQDEIGVSEPWAARMNGDTLRRLRSRLDPAAMKHAFEEGRRTTLAAAIDAAIDVLSPGAASG